ncbi:MAG: peptide deformylase [Phycisphaeraceae bacterium]
MPVKIDQLRVVYYPDPVLRRKAAPVEQITDEVRDVAERMVELMHQHRGVGLAAPQVGLSWRMFVANPTGEVEQDRVFINPVLTLSETVDVYEEGCLSLPGINADVRRPIHAVIEATDLAGETVRLESDDLPARVWQHEMDHLNGVLILDRMSEIDRTASKRAIKELEARVR